MHHLETIDSLNNRYFVLRHGYSEANAASIIVSKPDNGINNYGLSDKGRAQVEQSLRQQNSLDSDTIIISSDFLRAVETAQLVHARLACATSIRFDKRLRERFFGEFELTDDSNYKKVWAHDSLATGLRNRDVETTDEVTQRVTDLIIDCEADYQSATLLLVSHGDALQILQAAFAGLPSAQHRDQQHLETAQIRQMDLRPGERNSSNA